MKDDPAKTILAVATEFEQTVADETKQSAYSLSSFIKGRILAGMAATLPLFVTLWIVQFTYSLLITSILNPILQFIMRLVGLVPSEDMPWWWDALIAPGLVLILLGLLLFIMGGFARSRIYLSIDWLIRRVPVVKTIYDAVSNVIQSVGQSSSSSSKFEKVVLFNFPNNGVKSLGFVTSTLKDKNSSQKIYSVMLLTGVMPPSGFTLFVPAEDVIELDWSPTQAIQAIVSGGLSVPDSVIFEKRSNSLS